MLAYPCVRGDLEVCGENAGNGAAGAPVTAPEARHHLQVDLIDECLGGRDVEHTCTRRAAQHFRDRSERDFSLS